MIILYCYNKVGPVSFGEQINGKNNAARIAKVAMVVHDGKHYDSNISSDISSKMLVANT
jgi:hypothetical protein